LFLLLSFSGPPCKTLTGIDFYEKEISVYFLVADNFPVSFRVL